MDISEFVSSFTTDLSRAGNFQVSCQPPASLSRRSSTQQRNLLYRISAASYPSRSADLIEVVRNSEPVFNMAGIMRYEPISIDVIMTDTDDERQFFEGWLDIVRGNDSRTSQDTDYRLNYYDDMKGEITLMIFNNQGEISNQITLQEAYPIQITYDQLNWDSNDGMKMRVTLTYKNAFENNP